MTHTDDEGPVQVKRASKLRASPTRPQEGRAVRLLADHCDLSNAALQERSHAWRIRKVSICYGTQSAQLTKIRAADPDGQGRHLVTAQQQTLRRRTTTFQAFCKRVRDAEKAPARPRRTPKDGEQPKKAQRVGAPRCRPDQRFDQLLFVAGDGATWASADDGRWADASVQAVGRVKVHQHRAVEGRVTTLQRKGEYRRWSVLVVTETEPAALPATGRAVGVDVGVARFLTSSDGEVVANPRVLDAAQATIADLQRRKARARPGSGNRKRLRRQLAGEWRKVNTQRRDVHHQTARVLVDACDTLALDDLAVGKMTASAAGTVEQPGRNVAHKAGLNRSILDAGWGQFTSILTAKAATAGRRVILVNPASTSIDCDAGGASCTRPRQDTVVCPRCGPSDTDRNGARNSHTRAGLGAGQAHVA